MGHVNGSIHERSYRNQVVEADIVAAFLDAPSDKATMKLLGHVSLTRDPTAPSRPTQGQRVEAKGDLDVLEAKSNFETHTLAIQARYGTIKAAESKAQHDPLVKAELAFRNKLRRAHESLFQRKLTALFEDSRKEHFDTIGETALHNQHTGQTKPYHPKTPHFRFPEREQLVQALFASDMPISYQEKVESSCKIIRLYESLCDRCENPRVRHQLSDANSNIQTVANPVTLLNVKPWFLDIEPDIYPLRCPGTQCLFCLGNEALDAKARTKSYARPSTMSRHVDEQHLKYLNQPFTCPHPMCSITGVRLENHDLFKCHAFEVHSIVHSS
jgi:Protein of unknown function (DUF3435)